jgi:hypothetical protein
MSEHDVILICLDPDDLGGFDDEWLVLIVDETANKV